MIKKVERTKESVRFHSNGKRCIATNDDYPMIRSYGISKSNAIARLRLVVKETIKIMKGIHP